MHAAEINFKLSCVMLNIETTSSTAALIKWLGVELLAALPITLIVTLHETIFFIRQQHGVIVFSQ